MKWIELQTRTYLGREFKKYLEANEELPEEDSWKEAYKEDAPLPTIHTARVYINPDDILTYIETFSLEEMHVNPDSPEYDSIDICLKDGLNLSVMDTIESFNKKLEKFYKSKQKVEKLP